MTAALRLRLKSGLSRSALAKKAGVGLSTVQRLEKGWGGVHAKTAAKIAKALRCSMASLLAENGSEPDKP